MDTSTSNMDYNTLNERLLGVLNNGKTRFGCLNPLQSFTSMTKTLPTPHSVCIRYVGNRDLLCRLYAHSNSVLDDIVFLSSQW